MKIFSIFCFILRFTHILGATMSSIGFLQKKEKKKKMVSHIIKPTFTHACIIGETGCGKTTSMINPNLDSRMKLGHGLLVFDHKGNFHTTVKALAARNNRLEDVIMIGVPWGEKCNIIEDMDESSLVDFLRGVVGHSTDKFWEQSAIGLALPIMKVLDAIQKLDKHKLFKPFTAPVIREYKYNINALHKISICKNNLKRFDKALKPMIFNATEDLKINTFLQNLIEKGEKKEDSPEKEALKAYLHFEDMYALFKSEIIDNNQMKSTSSTYDNIITSLSAPLGAISAHPYINHNDININDALNKGKIIVFVCSQLPEIVLGSITNSLFKNFNERIGNQKHKDITIFIDEAQRVLNKDVDLPIDTLREARVEVFMAFQSKSLLVEKLGLEKAMALEVNLTKRYYFKSNMKEDGIASDDLETFQFLTNLDDGLHVHKSTPLFIKEKELFKAERSYQQQINAFDKYASSLPKTRKHYILHFIPSLYAKEQISICFLDGKIEHYQKQKPLSLKRLSTLKEKVFVAKAHKSEVEKILNSLEESGY